MPLLIPFILNNMMKFVINSSIKLLFAAILIVNLYGCKHNSIIHELQSVDSLIANNHNSEALTQLKTIDSESLNNENKAYYTLLLTLSEYKNYIDIKSDSAISEIEDYYRRHGNNKLLVRALIAKGCANEVTEDPDKAVECYHEAEDLSLNNDTNSLAYSKLRLGVLYQNQVIGSNTIALQKYKEALPLYQALGDKHYELICLSSIGGIYRNIEEKHDSAVVYLNEAIDLAKALNEPYVVFTNLFLLSEYYLVREHDYEKAKEYALQAILVNGITIDHPRAHYRLAMSYLSLGQPDSAVYYLNASPAAKTAMDSIVYYEVLSKLEQDYWKHEGKSKYYIELAHSIADSLTINGLNHRLLAVEKKYDLQKEELNNASLQSKLRGSWLVVALALLAAVTLFHFAWRYRNRLKAKENEYELLKLDLNSSLANLEQMQASISNYKDRLKETEDEYRTELAQKEALVSNLSGKIDDVKSSLHNKEHELELATSGYQKELSKQEEIVSNLTEKIAEAKISHKNNETERLLLKEKISVLEAKKAQSDEIKSIIDGHIKVVHELIQSSYELDGTRFVNKFKSLMYMPNNKRITTYWSNLQELTNDLYNNVLKDAIELSHGRLRDNDINLIALLCWGYTRSVIMICMQYDNIGTISNMKYKIAKKMGIPSLDEFIRPYQEEYKNSLK